MRKSLDDVIAEENRSNPSTGRTAPSPCSPRGSAAHPAWTCDDPPAADPLNCKTGGHRPSDDLLLGALLHPETLPAEGVGRAVHRIAAVLSAGRGPLARPDSTSTEVLWALWEASGLEKPGSPRRAARDPKPMPPTATSDAMIGLFEAASRFDEQMRGAGAEQFLDFIDAQDLPMDTLAARGVRQDAVEILTRLGRRSNPGAPYMYAACGRAPGFTTVRAPLLGTGDLVDICDARMRRPAPANPTHRQREQAPSARIRSYPSACATPATLTSCACSPSPLTRASTRLVLTAVRNEDEAPGEFFRLRGATDAENDFRPRFHHLRSRPATPALARGGAAPHPR